MAALTSLRTPFQPLPRVPAELPVALAVFVVAAPVGAELVAAPLPFAWVIGAVGGVGLALAAVAAVRRLHGRAFAAFLAVTLCFALGITAELSLADQVLVGCMCAFPLGLMILASLGPLVLVARHGAHEPDALEHAATTSAAWLLVVALVSSQSVRTAGVPLRTVTLPLAAALAAWSPARDLWRAWWLARVRRGAVSGVELARPWPMASERLQLTSASGDGPFRRHAHVERSDIVRIAWLRLGLSFTALALAACVAAGLFD